MGIGIYDWTAALPQDSQLGAFQAPAFTIDGTHAPTDGGKPIDPQEVASRAFLGIVFVVLLFLTVIIYGMWVATGVATEKSSRVMELMISAASPRQMLTGKVVGIGGAGLTQYLLIAVPALLVLAFQDQIAAGILGTDGASGTPIVGLTPGLLLGYGVFFLLGFTLFALIYAAMGSFVSRPDDLQTLSLPLSLVAMSGYLLAIMTLSRGASDITTMFSFIPPFSPFVMLARLMVDLYRLRIATEPRLSPDGRWVVVTLQTVAPGLRGLPHRRSGWCRRPTASASPCRRLTPGRARRDTLRRVSRRDGRTLAFISDRRTIVEEEPTAPKEREDAQPGPPPADGRTGGGATPDRPAPRRGHVRVVARWDDPGRAVVVGWRATRKADDRARQKAPRRRTRHAAGQRLPLRRPPPLPGQRRRLHRAPGGARSGSSTPSPARPGG